MKLVPGLLLAIASATASAGVWSVHARPLYGSENVLMPAVTAPDGRASVVGRANGVVLRSGGHEQPLPGIYPPIVEALWSPDSRYVALTNSEGGAAGTYDVYVVAGRLHGRTFKVRDILRTDALGIACPGEDLNLAAVGWNAAGTRLKVVAQVPPHSTCALMGQIQGLEIDVPHGRVLRILKAGTMPRAWRRQLGPELSAAR